MSQKRKKQYLKIKDWVSEILEQLVLGGTSQNELPDSKVAMVTVNDSQQDASQQSSNTNNQRKGGRQQRQDYRNRNDRNYTPRNQVTECGFCHIIQGKEVPQKYISMKFDERHQKVGDRPIFPNTCLPWMMLTINEREKVLEDNELYCTFCLRLLRAGRGANSCGQGRHTANTGHNGMCSVKECDRHVTMCKDMNLITKVDTRYIGTH